MVTQVPARMAWAVQLLELTPQDRVLEFGCGLGVAASLVADRLPGGQVTAIDRSTTALARAAARNAGHLASGRLALEQVSLGDFRTEELRQGLRGERQRLLDHVRRRRMPRAAGGAR